jgi:hypothetical protein
MRRLATALLAGAAMAFALQSASAEDWIGTWTASAQPAWSSDFPVPLGMPGNLYQKTIRQIARASIGGNKVRLVLSNEYGKVPLKIGSAHVALTDDGPKIKAGTDHALTFGGQGSITVPPGAPVVSDPVDLAVAPLSEISVSLYFPESAPTDSMHWDGHQTGFVAGGDKTGDVELSPDSKQTQRVYLSEILVDAPAGARAIVTFGDSITDGDAQRSTATIAGPTISRNG